MKGVVFTEFLEMVEDRFALDVVDRIIEAAELESGGAYTAVGTYDKDELIRLVEQLSAQTGVGSGELLKDFGRHLFVRFHQGYPQFFEGVEDGFAFLQNIEGYIHVEVLKLYPEAELPSFEYENAGSGQMLMIYRSKRPFADLAQGLIEGCAKHFGESYDVAREDVSEGEMNCVRFSLKRLDSGANVA